jgi:DNA-binding transcriptional MocR family regulator
MSLRAITWVFDNTIGSPCDKSVLIALADHTSEAGKTFPSLTLLCRKTEYDRRTVMRALARLEAAGFIVDTGQRVGATKKIKVWRLTWANEAGQSETVTKTIPFSNGVAGAPNGGAGACNGGAGAKRTLNNHQEPPYASQKFQEAWTEWENHRKHKRQTLTPEAIKRQFSRLKAMGEARAIRAINHSLEQGYTGLVEPRPDPSKRGFAGVAPLDKSKIDLPDRFKSWAVERYPDKREKIMAWHTWADVPSNGLREEWWRHEKSRLPVEI